ncbi:VOC family protein [Neolewinella antarctica]|uniref:VOC family protein n=1 Tax=Neolewinella antarctica TaxID=442734 RepID=A0ABX0X8K1_9BACT|nr:VOC family protein [Neolewinella antarctica]NJC25274.1 hypothetical protein [Neolewinella antarctica]
MPLPDPTPFLTGLFNLLEQTPGQFDHLYLDHICYRVTSTPEYERLRTELSGANRLLIESNIGGRPIATFHLSHPFSFRGREISVLELPAPKMGSPYANGYEHVELVTDRPLIDFVVALTDDFGIDQKQLDTAGMKKARNRDVRLELAAGVSVKFHERSLAEVIATELSATNN